MHESMPFAVFAALLAALYLFGPPLLILGLTPAMRAALARHDALMHDAIVDGASHVRTTPATAKIAMRLAAALKSIVLVEGIDMAFSGHPESAIFTLDVKA
jgi:hypothetical protein